MLKKQFEEAVRLRGRLSSLFGHFLNIVVMCLRISQRAEIRSSAVSTLPSD